uniref:EGF-like domain-containing protein n=1 Tax=Ciona savignyi TaxID=51511 RepID=H2Y8K1_CIOSA
PYRYMYWTDLGKDPHIGRVGMDGKDRSVIIHNTLLGWPNALTIDYASRKLFWADSKEDYIAHCELDGSNAIIVWQTSAAESSAISAISVFEDKLIWSELHKGSIMTSYTFASIHNGTFPHKAKQLQHSQITDLKIVHPLRQPMPMNPHPCSVDNGGCSDLCLLAPSGERSCACPEGFILDTHGLTCISNCTFSEFVCKNHKCIPFWWKCDGVNDCGDHSDEPEHCRGYYCTPGQYQCANSTEGNYKCMSPSGICDGELQCSDGSDELNCDRHVCLPTQFRCLNPPRCIEGVYRCDGKMDCPGGEDERKCEENMCGNREFACREDPAHPSATVCIANDWKCDGEKDCFHGDDESNCTVVICKKNEFQCGNNGSCIGNTWVCDGEKDCGDASDESPSICRQFTCDTTQFTCTSGLCIPLKWKCDSDNDCGDFSDEIQCVARNCSVFEFRCLDTHQCIPKSANCDGKFDCIDQSDERDCHVTCKENEFRCEKPTICLPMIYRCDGTPHCANGTDELNCTGFTPKCCMKGTFQCMDGTCVPMDWKCDGRLDCLDGSDEGPVCSSFKCPAHRPCKNQDICLPISKVCDGNNICGEKDEAMLSFC